MDAHRYTPPGRVRIGSLGLAIGLNAAILAGLIWSVPNVTGRLIDTTFTAVNIPVPPPPPPNPTPPQPRRQAAAPTHLTTVPPLVPTPPMTITAPAEATPAPDADAIDGPTGLGTIGVVVDAPVPPAPPALVGPSIDPRYADAFQPTYPPEENRAQHEGQVVVRVRIGVDGRVKQVERVASASDAFYRVTQAQALRRWRFRPATRGGIPVEAWYTVTVHFVLTDD